MIYIIDHQDSFTHNVVHQFSNFDKVECENFDKINQKKLENADVIVFSPGPGSPKDYPMSTKIYNKYKKKKKKLLVYVLDFNKYFIVKKKELLNKIKYIMVFSQM